MSKPTNHLRWRPRACATVLLLGLTPSACAAVDDYAEVPPQPSETPTVVEQALPETIKSRLQACAKEHAAHLAKHSYEVAFDIQTTARGEIDEIKAKGDRLDDVDLEACMTDALKTLAIRDYLRPDDSLTSPPEPQSVASSSRALLGTTALLPQAIRLAPIVISAPGGITIVVAVAIVVVAAMAMPKPRKPSKEECDEEKKWAAENCEKWLAQPNPHLEVVGPSRTMDECIFNIVSEECGGKPRNWVSPGRPGRRY